MISSACKWKIMRYEIRDGTYTHSPFALYWLHYPYCLSFIRAEAAPPPLRLLMIVSVRFCSERASTYLSIVIGLQLVVE